MRKDGIETKRKILSVVVRLFLEQGYKGTSVSQIIEEAGVSRGSYLNLFPTKDCILLDLVKTMFSGQFGVARSVVDESMPPVYTYAVETSIQLALTELNENLREIYLESYTLEDTAEYIYQHTTKELQQIFRPYLPELTERDFYEMEIGSASIMRGYMAHPCDKELTLEKKLERFLTLSLRVYKVPEEEIRQVIRFVADLDIRTISEQVMQRLFQGLAMQFDFSLADLTNK